jgi:hypothetical protein
MRHAAFTNINAERLPARLTIGLLATAVGLFVQIEGFRDDLAGRPVIEQQDDIGYAREPTVHAVLKKKENRNG